MRKFPVDELVPIAFLPYQINNIDPIAPIVIPMILLVVSRSFKIKTLNNKTKTGVVVIIMEASIGEVILKPWKNNSILVVIPNNPQKMRRIKSFLFTFSFTNDLIIQNSIPANKTLKKTNAEAPILSGITPFAIIWFTP